MSTANPAPAEGAADGHLTGPEHYTAGEILLAQSEEVGARVGPTNAQAIATQALAHFAAAQVAATIAPRGLGPQESWGGRHYELLSPDREAWERAL